MGPSLAIDPGLEERKIVAFIRKAVRSAGATGVVVGLSGGVDSSVVAAICTKALGRGKVLGVMMPSEATPKRDISDAAALARELGIETREVGIEGPLKAVTEALGSRGAAVARGNLQARLRMTILYFFANSRNLLVAGTGDRSEISIGFFTKFGDGGADILPIGHLFKSQVRSLAKSLGLPARIVRKPASPQLWPNHKATDEIPADYEVLDIVLHCLGDLGLSPNQAAVGAKTSREVVERTIAMIRRSAHKRGLPPTPRPVSSG